MFDLWLTSWRASLTFTAASLETLIAAQKSLASFGEGDPSAPFDENKIRDVFHLAADLNLRRWEDTAGALNNLPDWYHQMNRLPGDVLTDLFDAARRNTA